MLSAVSQAYKTPALVPLTPWIKTEPLEKPLLYIEKSGTSAIAKWNSKDFTEVFQWILYAKYGDVWETQIIEKSRISETLPLIKNGKKLNTVAVKSVDRLGNESAYDGKIIK